MHPNSSRRSTVRALLLAGAAGCISTVQTQAAEAPNDPTVSEVVVAGEQVRSLEQFTPTASRLDLAARETPATLDIITSATMTTRGFLSVEEAANSMPGVTSGGAPGDLENFHIRGFSDTQVTVLHNGIYVGPSDMVNRPQNAFNVESVEILKGPASVLYGQGAIGGAINVLNKAPSFGAPSANAQFAYGSFGTYAVGVGGSMPVGSTVAIRFDLSRTGTNGFVHNTDGDSTNGTLSVLWRASPDVDVQFSLDLLKDHPSGYWGTPLVTQSFASQPLKGVVSSDSGLTLDKRLRYINYNVSDAFIRSSYAWPQLLVKWRPSETLTFENYAYFYRASRKWLNSESYAFNPLTRLIDRDRFFVFHDQKLYGDQGSLNWKTDLFGRPNQLVVGFDYSHLDFSRARGFPDGDSIDPFNPQRGSFGPVVRRVSPTQWDDLAVFFEDVLSLTDDLKLVTGGRYDALDLDRKNFNANGSFNAGSSFSRTYHPFTYRLGLVYNLTPSITPYLSFTTGQDPVGSNIFVVNAGENFSLGKSRQYEAGVKASLPNNRASATLAIFDIRRKNILQAISPDVAVPIGSESSRGFEATGDVKLSDHLTINANLAYTDAKYRDFSFIDASGALVDASGNRIPNAPKWVGNLWASYANVFDLPVDVGGGLKHVSARTGNDANTLRLSGYTVANAYVTWRIRPNLALSARAENLTDEVFAQAADIFYPSEVLLGRPRFYQVDLTARF